MITMILVLILGYDFFQFCRCYSSCQHSADRCFQNSCLSCETSTQLDKSDNFFQLTALSTWTLSASPINKYPGFNKDISDGLVGVKGRELKITFISSIPVSNSSYFRDALPTLRIRRCVADFTAAIPFDRHFDVTDSFSLSKRIKLGANNGCNFCWRKISHYLLT